jgi:hypothetical protein
MLKVTRLHNLQTIIVQVVRYRAGSATQYSVIVIKWYPEMAYTSYMHALHSCSSIQRDLGSTLDTISKPRNSARDCLDPRT